VDIVRAQALSSIQGVAPDGSDIHLIVREASRGLVHLASCLKFSVGSLTSAFAELDP
jgi:hypothetical protein